MDSRRSQIDNDILESFSKGKKVLNISEISHLSGHHRHTVARYLDTLLLSGRVEMRQHGQKKKFFLADIQPESSLLNYSSHMIIILNTNLTIRWVNDAFLRMIDSTYEAITGLSIDLPEFDSIFSNEFLETIRSLSSGETRTLERSLTEKNELVVYLFSVSSVSFLQERPAIVITGENITENRNLQDAIRINELNLRLITENIRDLIIRWEFDGSILYVSPACEYLTGYVSGELTGKNLAEFIPDDDYHRIFSFLVKKHRKKWTEPVSFRFLNLKGNYIWFEMTITPRLNEDGDIIECISVCRDITERLEAEKKLGFSEEKYRRLFQSAKDAIILMELHEDAKNPSILEANNIALELVQYSKNEFLSNSLKDFISSKHLEKFNQVVSDFKVTKHVFFEIDILRKDVSSIPLEVNAHLFTIQEKPYVLAIARDITERKRIEKEVKEAHRRLEYILEFLPDPVFVLDTEGKITIWNRAMEDLTGKHKTEVIGKGDYEHSYAFYLLRKPALADYILNRDASILSSYSNIISDADMVTVDIETMHPVTKRQIWLWIKAAPLYDLDGNLIGSIETLRDISQRKLMEIEINRQNEIFEGISRAGSYSLQASSFLECVTHILSIIGKVSQVGKVLLLKNVSENRSEIQIITESEWFPDSTKFKSRQSTLSDRLSHVKEISFLDTVFLNGKPFSSLVRDLNPQEQDIFTHEGVRSFLLVPVIISEITWGAIGYFEMKDDRVWNGREIQALEIASSLVGASFLRFRALEELSRSERQFKTLTQNIPGIVFRLSLADSVMEYYNDYLENITGYSMHELSSGNFMSLIPLVYAEDKERVILAKREAITTSTPYEISYRIIDKKGCIHVLIERGRPILDENGKVTSIDGIIQDITGRRALSDIMD